MLVTLLWERLPDLVPKFTIPWKKSSSARCFIWVFLSFSMTQHRFIWILNPLRVRLNEFIVYAPGQEFSNHFHACAVLQSGSKQRIVRRDSSLHVELGELTTEVDLDIVGRLESIIQALSHCPSQPKKPANTQVLLWHSAWFMICAWLLHYITSLSLTSNFALSLHRLSCSSCTRPLFSSHLTLCWSFASLSLTFDL